MEQLPIPGLPSLPDLGPIPIPDIPDIPDIPGLPDIPGFGDFDAFFDSFFDAYLDIYTALLADLNLGGIFDFYADLFADLDPALFPGVDTTGLSELLASLDADGITGLDPAFLAGFDPDELVELISAYDPAELEALLSGFGGLPQPVEPAPLPDGEALNAFLEAYVDLYASLLADLNLGGVFEFYADLFADLDASVFPDVDTAGIAAFLDGIDASRVTGLDLDLFSRLELDALVELIASYDTTELQEIIGNLTTPVTIGGPGPDRLQGTEAAETLSGFGGRDVLIGGGGEDMLTGGEGVDVFVLAAGQAAVTITDWRDGGEGSDRLALDDQLLGLGDAGTDIRGPSIDEALGVLAEGRVAYDSTTGVLAIDVDGPDGPGGLQTVAVLEGGGDIAVTDIILF